MLGVQLYDLISQAGLKQEQVVAFYSFMSQLGMAAQAIDIVYQLNASEESDHAGLSARRLSARVDFLRHQRPVRCDPEKPERERPAARLSLSRSHPPEELQRRSRSRCAAGRSRAADFAGSIPGSASSSATRCSPTRTSRPISTPRKTSRSRRFSCAVNRDSDEVELESSRTPRQRARSDVRPQGAGESAARRPTPSSTAST